MSVFPVEETFSALITRRMAEMKLSQSELEARSGLADTTWSRWRTASDLPSRLAIPWAAKALGIGEQELAIRIAAERAVRAEAAAKATTAIMAKPTTASVA
jgi:transcriptional regulator with XRE-family HTH domain